MYDQTEITPAEALRILVRAALPHRIDISDLIGSGWFGFPKSMADRHGITPNQYKATEGALDRFNEARKNLAIRASGVFNGAGLRIPIDPADFSRGSFSIWKRELDCSIPGCPKRVFLDVLLRRQDVEALAGYRPKTECPADAYRGHWDDVMERIQVWPSEDEDDVWAKANSYSVPSVRARRKEFIDGLSPEQQLHIRKGGPRKPFPKPGENLSPPGCRRD